MENNNRKIITVSFVIAGFVSFLVARVLFQTLAVSIGSVGRLWAETSWQHGIPVSFGILMFMFLQFNSKVGLWADEVVTEVSKVVWPSRKDTTGMTIVTCIMLVVAATILGLFDLGSTSLVSVMIDLKI